MQLQQNVKMHNKFDVYVIDSTTDEILQSTAVVETAAVAHNILLNQIYTRLCAGQSYFHSIHFGTGIGIPTPDRTSLFNHLGTKPGVEEAQVKDFPVSSWKKMITILPAEYVGQEISEVGIAFGTAANNLVTHAMLKDSEGNPITISKTATQTILIYATFYVTITNNYENFRLLNMPNSNSLLNYLVGGAGAPYGKFKALSSLYDEQDQYWNALGATTDVVWTSDPSNRRRYTNVKRFDVYDAHGHIQALEFTNLFRIGLPSVGVHNGQPYTNVPIGVGNENTKKFKIPSDNVIDGTITVAVNGITVSNYGLDTSPSSNLTFIKQPTGFPNHAMSVAISEDGKFIAALIYYSPFLAFYNWNGEEWEPRSTPFDEYISVLSTGSIPQIEMTPDGSRIAIRCTLAPYVLVYDLVDGEWVRTSNVGLPGVVYDISMSDDGTILATCAGPAPYVRVYDWVDTEWVIRPTPPDLQNGTSGVHISGDGTVLAVRMYSVSPYIKTYDWSGTEWVIRPTPPNAMVNATMSINKNGTVIATGVGTNNQPPFIRVYDWSGTEWVMRPNINIPSGKSALYLVLANDGNSIAIVFGNDAPKIQVSDWNGTAWTNRSLPDISHMIGTNVSFNNNGNTLATTNNSPYFRVFSGVASKQTAIIFDTPPPINAVITADYRVKGVHKTTSSVIDVSFAIQFGEGV